MREQILELAKRKHAEQCTRCRKLGLPMPAYEDFEAVYLECLDAGFKCIYCGKQLVPNDTYPYKARPAIEHKISLSSGGTSTKDNLAISCHECNTLKGTMSAPAYLETMSALKTAGIWEKYKAETFKGRWASTIERHSPVEELLLGHPQRANIMSSIGYRYQATPASNATQEFYSWKSEHGHYGITDVQQEKDCIKFILTLSEKRKQGLLNSTERSKYEQTR